MTDSFTSEIPLRYQAAKYEAVPKEIRLLFDSARENRRGIYLHGGVGTGKTFIAYALYRHWQELRKQEQDQKNKEVQVSIEEQQLGLDATSLIVRPPAVFWNLTALLYTLRQEYRTSELNTSEQLLWQKNFLFIDDIGAEKVTEWVEEVIYLTINNRYERNIPIVFTSNYTLGELAERMGDRIASRISEMCDVVHLKGTDKRLDEKKRLEVAV